MIVQNMTSQNGNKVPNHFVIKLPENVTIFQSYKTVIAQNRNLVSLFYRNETSLNKVKHYEHYKRKNGNR